MTIRDVLRLCDDVRPNPYAPATKIRWLGELDGKVAQQVMLLDRSEMSQFQYTERDMEREMLVEFPHDEIYQYWLNAKLDYAAGELKRYNNDIELFNAAWGEFVRWFAATYDPANKECEDE